MGSPSSVTPLAAHVKPCETIVTPTTIETDRAIRLALAAQRREMQKAMRKSEVVHG